MSGRLPFTKMSGAGNDFVVLDESVWETVPGDRAAWVRAVCRRGVSVGADGVLVVARDVAETEAGARRAMRQRVVRRLRR